MIRKITSSAIAALCAVSLTACDTPGPAIVVTGAVAVGTYYMLYRVESSIEMEFDKIDRHNFESCESQFLKPFSERIAIVPERAEKFQTDFEGLEADAVYKKSDRHTWTQNIDDIEMYDLNSEALYILEMASNRGSIDATEKIGTAALYCQKGIEQDFELSEQYLRVAADGGSLVAMANYAHLAQVNPNVTQEHLGRVRVYLDQCLRKEFYRCIELVSEP